MRRIRAAVLIVPVLQVTPTVPVRTECTPAPYPGSATPTTPVSTASPARPSAPPASTTRTRSGPVCGPGSPAGRIVTRTLPVRGRRRSRQGPVARPLRGSQWRRSPMVSDVPEVLLESTPPCLIPPTADCTTSVLTASPRPKPVASPVKSSIP